MSVEIELRVGVFVVVSAVLLGGFVATSPEELGRKTYYVDFAYRRRNRGAVRLVVFSWVR